MNRDELPVAGASRAAPELCQRILIVDDEPRMRSSLRLLLAQPGREFAEVGRGGDAIAALERDTPDLMLLDIGLPDLSGLDVMRWVCDQRCDVSIIIVSGEGEFDTAIRALRYGAVEFLRKPEELDALPDKVDQALERRRLQREHRTMTARLAASERLHRFLVDRSPDLVFALDERGCFTFLNPRFQSLLGYGRGELIGRPWSVLVHEHDREAAHQVIAELRADAQPSESTELRLLCKGPRGAGRRRPHIVAMVGAIGIYEDDSGLDLGTARRLSVTYGVARDISARKRAEETVSFQALHDQLTGLPNRRLFEDHLEQAIKQAPRRGRMVGVMFVDLDRFKLVNDTYGHPEGDALLKAFAQRVRGCVRAGDTVARFAGDEFTVLLPDLMHAEDASIIANKIFAELQRPFMIGGHEFRATASIGIAVCPRDGSTAELLLKHADIAMFKVKNTGKNDYQVFSAEMNAGWQRRLELENDLRRAIDNGDFVLHWQPQVSLRQGRVIGAEVLLRWQHPVHGLLAPADFIGLAEVNGLICPLSDWVLEQACRQLAQWRRDGLAIERVAVNLSPLEFSRGDIVERVASTVERHGLPRDALEIEITENVLLEDVPGVIAKLDQLRERGVRISIDDFGTRYSSLNYLRRFPINGIKIDQSFVRDLVAGERESPIIQAIVGIARGFGLKLIAEGVETEYQRDELAALGCDEMQGFLFAAPASAEALARRLATEPPVRG